MAEQAPQSDNPLVKWLAFQFADLRHTFDTGLSARHEQIRIASGGSTTGAYASAVLTELEAAMVALTNKMLKEAVPRYGAAPADLGAAKEAIFLEMRKIALGKAVPLAYQAGIRDGGEGAIGRRLAKMQSDLGGIIDLEMKASGAPRPQPVETDATGDPGRPELGYSLYMAELESRRERGETLDTLKDEAEALLRWFHTSYPARAAPTVKTIKNRIRHRYNIARRG